jgi:hypothetical protein
VSFRFLSWEFLFGLNIVFAILLPFLLRWLPSRRAKVLVFVGASLLPHFLALGSWFFTHHGDLEFHLKLTALHWNLSVINLFLLWQLLEGPYRFWRYFGFLLCSAIVSVGALFLTPSLSFTDPFWGVSPGTVSIDPIISLPPYYLRLWVCFMAALVILRWRRAAVYLISIWAAYFLIGQFTPSQFLSVTALKRQFKEEASFGSITVYVQDPKVEEFSAEVWAREFGFHLEELKKRLPEDVIPNKDLEFSIFIYRDDDSKNKWIHARQTQIGHFVRGEMHLSHQTPLSPILRHELAHLLHGQSTAPWYAYLDSFYLEGFAVAISEVSLENAVAEAAAVAQVLPEGRKLVWPRTIRFYGTYPASASYALAGGFAALALQHHQAPWNFPVPDPKDLLQIKVSEENLNRAKEIFARPMLFEDPDRRDCARLEHEFENYRQEKNRIKLEKICPNSEILTAAISEKLLPFQQLKGMMEKAKDKKLFKDKILFYESLTRANQSKLDSKRLAKNILQKWNYSPSPAALAFKSRLEWEAGVRP